MKTYRIDNRIIEVKGVIYPQTEAQLQLVRRQRTVEEFLESRRPQNKPARPSIVILFTDFNAARDYWSKQSNAIFYRTIIEEKDIIHKGDYVKIEQVFSALGKNSYEEANELANDYWNGRMTDNPIVEVLVSQTTVDKVLSDSESQRRYELKLKHRNVVGNFKPELKIKRVTDDN
jgi:hypothetical protein